MTCALCDGPLGLLGALGRAVWMRCRNCGTDQKVPATAWADLVGEE